MKTSPPLQRRILRTLGASLLTITCSINVAAADLTALRTVALDDIFVLREFRAGKNSFVESPERHVGVWTGAGYRYTLLDVEGQGSLRHIWTTRGDGDPYFDWEFYVDGEAEPSVRATDVELIEAARLYPVPVAPTNYIAVHNRAFNFYLPVPFDQRLRIDVVQRQPSFWLWFAQLDYRLEDSSLAGARLFAHRTEAGLGLSYVGLPSQQRTEPASRLPREKVSSDNVMVPPGETVRLIRTSGPGIVRELRLRQAETNHLRLLIRYDGASGYAVNAPADAFFGPFQGVSYYRHGPGDASCYLPMPFEREFELLVRNEGEEPVQAMGSVTVERVPVFGSNWGYFHALHQQSEQTEGHRPHQVMYVRGRGHWLGMTLYKTGHDHGGGDFAVVDGEGDRPAFLHGINGEDYFTFAWFGQGAHHPYAIAHSNDDGRYRHHFENVYPFQHSLAIEWGAFANLKPESVSVWYQDQPDNIVLADGARAESVEWDVFGPIPIPHDAAGHATVPLFSVLPSVAELDAGKEFECRLVKERFTAGWMKEWSVGPMLNLTYIGRHGTTIDYEAELGGMGHAFLARRWIESPRRQSIDVLFAHDDPIEVWVNGRRVYEGEQQFNGFESMKITLPLRKGRNEIVVRLSNYFNRNFNWNGFFLRLPEELRP
jgi:hypothetical protein